MFIKCSILLLKSLAQCSSLIVHKYIISSNGILNIHTSYQVRFEIHHYYDYLHGFSLVLYNLYPYINT